MTPPILELVAASKTFRIRSIFGGEKSVAALQQVSLKLGDLALKARAEDAKKNKHTVKGSSEYETPAERAAEKKPQ